MQIAFVLDVIIAVLLVLTITYAVRLNQRLAQLRSDKNELLELAKTFAEATVKAEAGIKALKISSEALQGDMQKAEALRDDLAYLVDRGGRSADEMAASVRTQGAQRKNHRDDDDDDLLIEEAIRAASSGGQARPGRPFAGQDDMAQKRGIETRGLERGQNRGETTQRISSHLKPAAAQRDVPSANVDRKLGGGLGGLSPEDRLLDKHASGQKNTQEAESIGDTDAARELLKALSAMK